MKISSGKDNFLNKGLTVWLLLITAIIQIGFSDHSAAADVISISLLEAVEIDGASIYLGQIARIDGPDLQLIQQLKGVVVGKSPLPGRSRVVETDYVRLRLKQNNFNVATINLNGSQHVRITRSFVEVGKAEIEKIISDYMYHEAFKGEPSVNVKAVRVSDRLILPKGRITYQVIPPKNTNLLGKFPIAVQFHVDGELKKKVWAIATVAMVVDVVVAKRPLRKHKPIQADDVHLQKMDLAGLPSTVITDPQDVIGKRTRQTINSKAVLRTDLIELPPIIKRGDVVTIVLESKGLRITARGKAKRRGGLGDRIPVENIDSKKILYAQIVDSHTVKLEY
jgi:flagella basal body P-ring formation protein FlgA